MIAPVSVSFGDAKKNPEQLHHKTSPLPGDDGCPCAGGAELPQGGLMGFIPKSMSVFL